MTLPTFAIITPSYTPDFERCAFLCESIREFVSPEVRHYIVVDANDYALFSSLADKNTQITVKEDLLPRWLQKIPFSRKNIWFNWRGFPVRGWLIQQIIKIAQAAAISEEVAVFVDSDVAFVRPVDFHSLLQGELVRFHDEPEGNFASMTDHVKWHQEACKLLGIPPTPMPAPDYIADIITWRRDNAVRLCQQLESVSGKHWISAIIQAWHFSEYVLYGTFVDRVLGEDSGHYPDASKILYEYFEAKALTPVQLQKFVENISPEHVAVMISAKAGMEVDAYRHALKSIATSISR